MEQKILVIGKKKRERGSHKLRELSVLEKEKIYQQHLGLVVNIAKRHINRSPGFTFEDLISEGILGLFKAAEKFDVKRGFKFSTYATWWIRESIERALNERGKTIHIPGHIIEASRKYRKVRQKLFRELGQEPLTEEIAAAMKITIDRAQRIRKFLENPSKIISLETLLGEDEDNISLEFIEDPKVALPVALAFENIFKEDLEKTLKSLTPREEKIIKMRFGLAEDGKEHTLQEIADEMGLSKTRIQQIVKRVLARLRKKES